MNKIIYLFLAFLIYSPTLVLIPQFIPYILISIIGLLFWLKTLKLNGFTKNDIFLTIFFIISIIIYFIGKSDTSVNYLKSDNDYIPYTFFIITSISFSRLLNNNVLRYVLFFVLFETMIGIIQYVTKTPYFIKPLSLGENSFGDSDLMYYNKVYGLSSVTSIFALKIFSGFLLTFYLDFNKKIKNLIYFLLCFGLLFTFNRTSIIASFLFLLIVQLNDFTKHTSKRKVGLFFLSILFFSFIFVYSDNIINQFFRGKQVDMSGRDLVFPYYINFISENLIFGNFFTKHWIELLPGKIFHAHNSYLQTFANMGFVFGLVFFVFLFKNISKSNIKYILPILVYSLFQYGILWGVSYIDIIFFYLLFNLDLLKKNNLDYR